MFYWLPHPSYASQITLILLRRGPPNCDTNTKHFSCSSFLLLPNFHTICKHMSSYSTIYCHNHNDQWPQSNEAHLPQSSHPPAVQFISSFNLYRVWLQFSNLQTKLSKSSISGTTLKYFTQIRQMKMLKNFIYIFLVSFVQSALSFLFKILSSESRCN